MIQYPINVQPQNQSIDMSDVSNSILFNFQGDYLSGIVYRITNYDTGTVEYSSIREETGRVPIGYNNYRVQWSLSSSGLVNGRRYMLEMMFVQRTEDGLSPICDMAVVAGTIQLNASSSTEIFVSKGMTAIYPWGKSDNVYSPIVLNDTVFNPMVIQIGGEKRTIISYTDDVDVDGEIYGKITLDSAITVSQGDTYQIYTNALITPQYFFKCESKPTITLSHTENQDEMSVTGTYVQANQTAIKYYILRLYWSNNSYFINNDSGGKSILVEETNRIYSQHIAYKFRQPYYHDENYSTTTSYYKIECEVVTQNDYTITQQSVFDKIPTDYSRERGVRLYGYSLSWDSDKGRVIHTLRGYGSGGQYISDGAYELFRKDVRNGEEVKLLPHHFEMGQGGTLVGYDLSAPLKGEYQYTLKRFDENGGVVVPVVDETYTDIGNFPSQIIDINESAYYITALIPYEFSVSSTTFNQSETKKQLFEIGDTWKFIGDIQNTTVTNNLDTMTHVGYGRYINTTSTDVNYMSGTLSAMIGSVNCAERKYIDDIALVKAWREFITQKNLFLLKSQKGDVWVVDIVENPYTEYDESHKSIPTTFSFSWAEAYNINDIELYDRNPMIPSES